MVVNQNQQTEINELRDTKYQTRRKTVDAVEELLYQPIPVLDHGFIRVIDYMGNDEAIVQAARVSYGKGTKQISNDRGLIRYLLRHRHTTPFEMCEMKFHIKMPIFVARQWIRHRSANVNEYSARYSILEDQFYVPDRHLLDDGIDDPKVAVLAPQSENNKQGREGNFSIEEAKEKARWIKEIGDESYALYEKLLNETEEGQIIDENKTGLARELARMVLPANVYTQWYWKIDLHNLLHFLELRADAHAQYEIRIYAEKMLDIVAKWVPHVFEAFQDYRVGGANLSAAALKVVRARLAGQDISQEESGLSKREWAELEDLLAD